MKINHPFVISIHIQGISKKRPKKIHEKIIILLPFQSRPGAVGVVLTSAAASGPWHGSTQPAEATMVPLPLPWQWP